MGAPRGWGKSRRSPPWKIKLKNIHLGDFFIVIGAFSPHMEGLIIETFFYVKGFSPHGGGGGGAF